MTPHWYLLHRDLHNDGPVCLNGIPLPTKDYRDPDVAELASPKHTILSICDGVHKYLGPLKSDTLARNNHDSPDLLGYHNIIILPFERQVWLVPEGYRLDQMDPSVTSTEKYLEQFEALYCDLEEYPEFQLVDTPQGTKVPQFGPWAGSPESYDEWMSTVGRGGFTKDIYTFHAAMMTISSWVKDATVHSSLTKADYSNYDSCYCAMYESSPSGLFCP